MGWFEDAIMGSFSNAARQKTEDYNTGRANDWAQGQREGSQQYQTDMSNTAITRKVADLKNAGVNPILGLSEVGASTPSGAMGSAEKSKTMQEDPSVMLLNSLNAERTKADTELIRAEKKGVDLNNKLTENTVPESENWKEYAKSKMGKYMPYVKEGLSAIGNVVGMGTKIGMATSAAKIAANQWSERKSDGKNTYSTRK